MLVMELNALKDRGKNCCKMKFDLSFWSTNRLGFFYLGMINFISLGAVARRLYIKLLMKMVSQYSQMKSIGSIERV